MTISDQQDICTRPFQWCEIHPDGSVFLCCPAWLKRPIGNLLQQGVEQIWNGPVAQELRKTIFNGSFHNCNSKRCPHLHGRTPPLQPFADLADGEVKAAIDKRQARLEFLPSQLNLCFDQSCTLACPSCRQQVMQASGTARKQAEQLATIVREQLLPGAETVTLSGFGDPFGSPTYLQLLRRLNQTAYPRLRSVRLHSNGQLLSEQLWASLPGLQPLVDEIEISLDAASEATYRCNRPGGDFSRLLNNLAFIAGLNSKLTLSMVVQQNNWREIPQLLELADDLAAEVYLSRLVNWGTFSQDEFRQRAVHLPHHPEHRQFRILLQTVQKKERLRLGNLTEFTG